MALVEFRSILKRDWLWLDDAAAFAPGAPVVVTLARLQGEAETLFARAGAVGVVLAAGAPAEALAPHLDRLAMVALDFPSFADGRAYSNARVLRDHLGFLGEIRAVGDVLADQLGFMARCGFSSAALAPHVDEAVAARALARYSVAYQAASDDKAPAHRLRRMPPLKSREVA
ncbi:MAG: DUF934 domain-containing protein [Pseudomonadota bacterium]